MDDPRMTNPEMNGPMTMTMHSAKTPARTKIVAAMALAATFAAGYGLQQHLPSAHAVTSTAPGTASPVGRGAVTPDAFSSIVESQGAAVVNISVSGMRKTSSGAGPGLDESSPLYDFLRRFGVPQQGGQEGVPVSGQGSGFIVDASGIVLTNAHVVANADEVTVKLTDKREFKAKVLGVDKPTDVAVLRIEAKDLPTVKIGNPQQTRVGEWVVAIGSPFGFENTVTAGIVSAKTRTLPDEGYVPFLQTDVAINPGNSGGPLFNVKGEVIGINSQIYSRSGGYQGLSFAIPIDVAMDVQRQLVTNGRVSRGKLGVSIQELNQSLADSFGLEKPRGALVAGVEPGSPAAKAGIEAGDVIVKFNGQDVVRSSELSSAVAGIGPGKTVKVEVWRKGKSRELTVITGEIANVAAVDKTDAKPGESGGKLGVAVRPLAPEEQRQVEGGKGLVVEEVADGPAARAGIRPGDVIISVNGQTVSDANQLRSQLNGQAKSLAILLQRDGQRLFVPIRLG